MATYEPGSYRKGEDVRTAHTKADAVALVFEGFTLESNQDEAPEYTTEPTVPDVESDEPESSLEGSGPEFPEPTSLLDATDDSYVSGDNTGKEPWS